MALKSIESKNMWKHNKLADQMQKGPKSVAETRTRSCAAAAKRQRSGVPCDGSALKIEDGKPDEITYEQFMHFLERKQVRYTPKGLAFFIERAGLKPDKEGNWPVDKDGKKRPLKTDKFVRSWEGLVLEPIRVTRTG